MVQVDFMYVIHIFYTKVIAGGGGGGHGGPGGGESPTCLCFSNQYHMNYDLGRGGGPGWGGPGGGPGGWRGGKSQKPKYSYCYP